MKKKNSFQRLVEDNGVFANDEERLADLSGYIEDVTRETYLSNTPVFNGPEISDRWKRELERSAGEPLFSIILSYVNIHSMDDVAMPEVERAVQGKSMREIDRKHGFWGGIERFVSRIKKETLSAY